MHIKFFAILLNLFECIMLLGKNFILIAATDQRILIKRINYYSYVHSLKNMTVGLDIRNMQLMLLKFRSRYLGCTYISSRQVVTRTKEMLFREKHEEGT